MFSLFAVSAVHRARSASATTASTSTSRPSRRWSSGTTTANTSSSTTPGPAAASPKNPNCSLRSGGRVPRRRQLGAAAAGDQQRRRTRRLRKHPGRAEEGQEARRKKKREATPLEEASTEGAPEARGGPMVDVEAGGNRESEVESHRVDRVCRGARSRSLASAPALRRPTNTSNRASTASKSRRARARRAVIPDVIIDYEFRIDRRSAKTVRIGMPLRPHERRPLARGLHRQPARGAEVHADRILDRAAVRPTPRSAFFNLKGLTEGRDLRPALQHGDQPRTGGAARLHRAAASRSRSSSNSPAGPRATTASTRSAPRRSACRSTTSSSYSGGSRRPKTTTPLRFVTPMVGAGFCFIGAVPGVERLPAGRAVRQRNLRPVDDPAGAVPPEPDDLRRAARRSPAEIEYYGGRVGNRNDPLAGNDRAATRPASTRA